MGFFVMNNLMYQDSYKKTLSFLKTNINKKTFEFQDKKFIDFKMNLFDFISNTQKITDQRVQEGKYEIGVLNAKYNELIILEDSTSKFESNFKVGKPFYCYEQILKNQQTLLEIITKISLIISSTKLNNNKVIIDLSNLTKLLSLVEKVQKILINQNELLNDLKLSCNYKVQLLKEKKSDIEHYIKEQKKRDGEEYWDNYYDRYY